MFVDLESFQNFNFKAMSKNIITSSKVAKVLYKLLVTLKLLIILFIYFKVF